MKYVDLHKRKVSNEKAGTKGRYVLFITFVILAGLAAGFILFKDKILKSFDPISVVASVSAAELKETDGRTNILLLGYDKRSGNSYEGSQLTDTIMVASISKVDNNVVLISVPRDLWVNDYHNKINSVYTLANMKGLNGADELKREVQDLLGIPIHYHALVTFDLFQKVIDTLGGIDVNVDNTFTDNEYPIQGRENDTCGINKKDIEEAEKEGKTLSYPCRYESITFNAGPQKMDGITALKFVRSRHSLDNGEGTDFARAKRQQKILMAVRDKFLSTSTLLNPSKIKELYETFSNNIDTNVDLATLQTFYLLYQKKDSMKIISIVLDDRGDPEQGGLLYSPQDTTLYNNAWVLVPQTGNFSQIHAYVQKYLFSAKQE